MRSNYIFLFLLLAIFCGAQTNLVPNASFETYTACPNNSGQVNRLTNWYNPTGTSPDYFNGCGTYSYNVPASLYGNQAAVNGSSGFVGLLAYVPNTVIPTWNFHEYVQVQLSSPLLAGQTYYVSFHISLADSSTLISDAMGAYVSQTPVTTSNLSNFNLAFSPQVSNPQGQFVNDVTNWQQISGSFIASGGEQYLTIGNFKDDNNNSFVRRLPALSLWGDFSYYYMDEVCLSLNAQTCNVNLSVGINGHTTDVSFFYYNPNLEAIVFENPPQNYQVAITDITGACVRTLTMDDNNDKIDVSSLKKGCYFIRVSDSRNESIKKIIVY